MIRVLHVVASMGNGGVQSFLMNYFRHIDRNLVQFDFLVMSNEVGVYEKEIAEYGGKIYRVRNIKNGIFAFNRDLLKFLKEHRYKCIHSHLNFCNAFILSTAKKAKVPIRISHSHNSYAPANFFSRIARKFLRRKIVSVSTNLFSCSTIAGVWLYGNSNFTIIANAIDADKFVFDFAKRKQYRKCLNLQDSFVITCVATLSERKNQEMLIKVFSDFFKKNKQSMLLLIGDGEIKGYLNELIKKMNLEKNILLLGNRNDVKYILDSSDVFCLISHAEGLPVSVIEAQANGLKCIISKSIDRFVDFTGDCIFVDENSKDDICRELSNSTLNVIHKKQDMQDSPFSLKNAARKLTNLYIQMDRHESEKKYE